jgi:hypothetical protein
VRWALAWLGLTSDGNGRKPAVAVALLGQAGERRRRRRVGPASVMGAWPPPGALDPASACGRREQPPCRGKAMVFGLRASSREAAGAGAPQGCKPCGAASMATAGKARRGEHPVDDGVLGLRGICPRRAVAARSLAWETRPRRRGAGPSTGLRLTLPPPRRLGVGGAEASAALRLAWRHWRARGPRDQRQGRSTGPS